MTQNPPSLFPIAPLLPVIPRIKIVDVGAMSLGDGSEPYAALMRTMPCDIYGFEPVESECDKLKASAKPGHHYLPYFIATARNRHSTNATIQ